jgi:hypothetical protein
LDEGGGTSVMVNACGGGKIAVARTLLAETGGTNMMVSVCDAGKFADASAAPVDASTCCAAASPATAARAAAMTRARLRTVPCRISGFR